VFTSTDNFWLKDYKVTNLGFNYEFGKNKMFKAGFQALNILNEKYQSVASGYMPGRNIPLI
jgi:iron complex outermembrane receptor protein